MSETRVQPRQLVNNGWTTYDAVVPTRTVSDDPTYEISFASVDLTSTLYAGMRMKFTQDSTVRYFIITKVALDGSDTDVTLYGGTDYDVGDTASLTISDLYYSVAKAPAGFPVDPDKWTVEVTDTSDRNQGSPTGWYNLGSISIDIPIGLWEVSYNVFFEWYDSAGANLHGKTTLSTANNSESDSDFTASLGNSASPTGGVQMIGSNLYRSKIKDLSTKDTFYLNAICNTSNTIYFRNNYSKLFIRARCAYL